MLENLINMLLGVNPETWHYAENIMIKVSHFAQLNSSWF